MDIGARKLIDSVQYVADTLASVSETPTKVVSSWFNEKIAPAYWVPDSELSVGLKPYRDVMCCVNRLLCRTELCGMPARVQLAAPDPPLPSLRRWFL